MCYKSGRRFAAAYNGHENAQVSGDVSMFPTQPPGPWVMAVMLLNN